MVYIVASCLSLEVALSSWHVLIFHAIFFYVQLWCGGDGRAPGERQRKRAAELAPRVPAEGGRRRQPAAARDGEAQGMLVYSIISYCQPATA